MNLQAANSAAQAPQTLSSLADQVNVFPKYLCKCLDAVLGADSDGHN